MKKAVRMIQPKTAVELKQVIQKVWDDFPQSKINDLVNSFYQRLNLVIQENGESIQSYFRHGLSEMTFVSMPIQSDILNLNDVISELIENSNNDTNLNSQIIDDETIIQDIDDFLNDLSDFSEENDQTLINQEKQNFEINNSDFTQEEDKLIYDLFMKYGPRWTKIASFLKNRRPVQIKSRYRNVIQKNISIN